MTKVSKSDRLAAIARLQDILKPGDTVSTILRHVSRSGMSRSISLVVARADGVVDITYRASQALGEAIDQKNDGVKVPGAGTDMGFHLVYSLSRTLWPDGFVCIGQGDGSHAQRCPSNDHTNGDRDYTPHTHSDGGYALRHRWL